MRKILFVGESWFVHTQESKGFDIFTFDKYEEGTEWIKKALTTEDTEFVHIPCHRVEYDFPTTLADLQQYSAVIFSDVGANTLLLPMKTFAQLEPSVNKLELVKEYVAEGGAFVMVGGYLTYQGIQARGCYKDTAIEEILPVNLLTYDDRVETPQGSSLTVVKPGHPVLDGIPAEWPKILGYNRLISKENAEVLVKSKEDPIITVGTYGKGRTCAYATDCAPHWSPVSFCEWEGYTKLWHNLIDWLSGTK